MFNVVSRKNKSFYTSWLVLGLLQTGLFLAGNCTEAVSLFSEKSAEAEPPAVTSHIPVRISRTLFEKDLSARIQTDDPSRGFESEVSWNENAAQVPPSIDPGQVPIAVEKDHIGCAEFTDLSPMRLCFLIQGDVDSVALKPNQAWLEGTDSVLNPKCVQVLNLIDSGRTANGFYLRFAVIPTTRSGCQSQPETLMTEISTTA